MKIEIEVQDDVGALMRGVAGYYEQTLEEWALSALRADLAGSLEGAARDVQSRASAESEVVS